MSATESAKLLVRVQPNAKQNQVTGIKDGVLQLRLAAPPVEGKANEALIKFLSKLLDIPKSRITIERGQASRNKALVIGGLGQAEVSSRINNFISPPLSKGA